MSRFLLVLAIAAVAGFFYVTAAPGGMQSGPTPKQFAALKKQVAVLNKKVKNLNFELGGNFEGDACLAALTSDELQDSWMQVDKLGVNLAQPAIFGVQSAINDKQACEGLLQPKVPRPVVSPSTVPTSAPFSTLIAWLAG
jgi:hypothetical protein